MIKKWKKIGMLLVSAMLFTGCVDTPDDVKSDMAKRETEEERESIDSKEIELVPISEVVKNAPKTWEGGSGNARFSGFVKVPEVGQLHKWKVGIADNAYRNPEEARKQFLKYCDNLEIKNSNNESIEGIFTKIIEYEDDEETGSDDGATDGIAFYNTGEFAMIMLTRYWSDLEKSAEWYASPMALEYEKNYYFDWDGSCMEGEDDVYSLYNGEKVSIKESMNMLQEIAESYCAIEPEQTLLPDRVSIFKNEEQDCYMIESHMNLAFENVPLDSGVFVEQDIKRNGNICRLGTDLAQLNYGQDEGYPYSTMMLAGYKAEEPLETYDKIIDFEQAWKLLYAQMADEKEVVIDRADLVYSVYYEPTGDTAELWWNDMEEVPELFAVPVWRFTSYQNGGASYVYHVDALTGQVSANYRTVLEVC